MAGKRVRAWAALIGVVALSLASQAAAGTTIYIYDARGRVTGVTYTDGTSITYTYDSAGNRTQYLVTGAVAPTTGPVSYSIATNSANNSVPLALSGTPASGVSVSTAPAHGSASVSGTTIQYTPTSGYSGSDTFQYTAWNPSGTSTASTVTLTIAAGSIWGSFIWGPPNTWF